MQKSLTQSALVLITALCAVLAMPGTRAAEVFRLDRIGIARFVLTDAGKLERRQGLLFVDGTVLWRPPSQVDRPVDLPLDLLDRNLISTTAWQTYRLLGTASTWNFKLLENAVSVRLGDESFHFIGPSDETTVAMGKVINISTRARLAGANDVVIAGFVVDEHARKVLIRGVGPGLTKFGVSDAASNPRLTVLRDGQPIASNDNWNQHALADEIREAATRVGAFPLAELSADAAVLAELAPGAYTVHLESAAVLAAPASVLVEVYSVPEV